MKDSVAIPGPAQLDGDPIPATREADPRIGHIIQASDAEWAALTAAFERKDAGLAAWMPTERDCLDVMQAAWARLQQLGWREAIYCPKDGSSFDAIEPGSTGIHRCHYSGEWPKGSWWAEDAGDLWPSHPILYRQSEEEKRRWNALGTALGRTSRDATEGGAP